MAGGGSDKIDFLQRAYARWSDPKMLAMMATAIESSLAEAREEAVKANEAGVLDLDMDSFDDLYREIMTPAAFKGEFISTLEKLAADFVQESGYEVTAEVALIHSLDVNSFCFTESGNIGFNFGVVGLLLIWIRSALGLYSLVTGSDDPHCTCFSEDQFASSLISVATAIATKTIAPLRNACVLGCSCRPFFDTTLSTFVTMTELFVLLHEYGHLVQYETKEPEDSHEREMLADSMAIDYLSGVGLERRDAVMFAGLFLHMIRFAYIVEGIGENHDTPTHPSPKSRIDRIMGSLAADADPTSAVFVYSGMFNHMAGLLARAYECTRDCQRQGSDADESEYVGQTLLAGRLEARGDLAGAVEQHRAEYREAALKMDRRGMADTLLEIGRVRTLMRDKDGVSDLMRSLEIRYQDGLAVDRNLYLLGMAREVAGDLDGASEALDAAWRASGTQGREGNRADIAYERGLVLVARAQMLDDGAEAESYFESALTCLAESREAYHALSRLIDESDALMMMAQIEVALGRQSLARDLVNEALNIGGTRFGAERAELIAAVLEAVEEENGDEQAPARGK